ncbi:MAG: FeoB-associated Cys-rich membrane protein [Firmicutes bacterium]|nr:FeoB-associated Cys-rich membrane protein [Bacillota bacterium]
MSSFIIGALLAAAFVYALKTCLKDARVGGCSGNCSGCRYSCSAGSGALEEYLESLRIDAE